MDAIETLVQQIREAADPNTSEQTRAAGAQACRTLLAAFEARQGETLAQQSPTAPTPPIAAVVNILRNTPVDQLLDLEIAKLQSITPAQEAMPRVSIRVPLVAVPKIGGRP